MRSKKKLANIIWFTGLSGSGKSTLSKYLFEQLKKKGLKLKKLTVMYLEKKTKTKKNFQKKDFKEQLRHN